jgi:hypothetical protein
MSSLARRTLRTTVTAAGIAALGAGLAAPAFAAPALPALPSLPGADALPGTDAIPGADALSTIPGTDALPGAGALPPAFSFEAPTVDTAADDADDSSDDDVAVNSALPGVPQLPPVPGTDALSSLPAPADLPLPPLPGPEALAPVVNAEGTGLPDPTAISPADFVNSNAVVPTPPTVDPAQVAALAQNPTQVQGFAVS